MKNQNEFVKGALLFLIGILNTLGLGAIVPSVKHLAEKIGAGKKTKLVGYIPLAVGVILLLAHFTGGVTNEDKEYIKEQVDSVKIVVEIPVDTVSVDSLK